MMRTSPFKILITLLANHFSHLKSPDRWEYLKSLQTPALHSCSWNVILQVDRISRPFFLGRHKFPERTSLVTLSHVKLSNSQTKHRAIAAQDTVRNSISGNSILHIRQDQKLHQLEHSTYSM